MQLRFFVFCLLLLANATQAQLNIIPAPASIKQPARSGTVKIGPSTRIVLDGSGLETVAAFFNDYLQKNYSFALPVGGNASGATVIRLNFEKMENALPGAYRLVADNKGIAIYGDNEEGVFYGIQTLIQLLPVPAQDALSKSVNLAIPYVTIDDSPRFGYRGMMLDACRHFMSIDFIKRYIDYLALHKMNYFHWHLTDDQGWRIEVKKYPRLTEVGAWRNGTIIGRYPGKGNTNERYGGFYTQEQVKDIVLYAAKRYITVVPEIEMPGHGSAAIAAYPELSCFPGESTYSYFPKDCTWSGDTSGKQVQQTWGVFADVFCAGQENTFRFLQDVIDEIIPLFPGRFIHVGGDECPKSNWKRCPSCQQRMKDNNLKDEHELQSYFIQRMEKYVNGKGKILVGWDEILEGGLAPNATVMSWRGEEGGIEAAKQNHDVIMTPTTYMYFDYSQTLDEDSVTIGGYVPIEKVYNYDPVPAVLTAEQGSHILGAQANLWSEYITKPAKVEYMIFPRLAALSEVVWSKKENRNWNNFQHRLLTQFKRYDLWGATSSKAYFDLKAGVSAASGNKGLLWTLQSNLPGADIRYTITPANQSGLVVASKGLKYAGPVPVRSSSTLTGWILRDGKTAGKVVSADFNFSKSTGKKITLATPPAANYPGDGPVTLVNGIYNDRGLSRSREFLGFEGTDCEATIDFGEPTSFSNVVIHTLEQQGSWIYFPSAVEISISTDGSNYRSVARMDASSVADKRAWPIAVPAGTSARYVRVKVTNNGVIADNLPGAGHKAWLFIDEIEIR